MRTPRYTGSALLLTAILCLPACGEETKANDPWPFLPQSTDVADALVSESVRGSAGPSAPTPPQTATEMVSLLRERARLGSIVAGWPAIVKTLRSDIAREHGGTANTYVLFGTHHDSGAQVSAFRRLTGHGGISGFSAIVVEQFEADGRWQGVPAEDQLGDSTYLEKLRGDGFKAALSKLVKRQRSGNYTAWKYDYLKEFEDMLVTARALDQKLLGCDMPDALRDRLAGLSTAKQDRLREIHCYLSMKDALKQDGPKRVAVLFGMDHVKPPNFPALLEPGAEVITLYAVGGRPGKLGVERDLGKKFRTTHPLLIPLDEKGRSFVLIINEGWLKEPLSKARGPADDKARNKTFTLHTDSPGTLHIDKKSHRVETSHEIDLPPGPYSFSFEGTEATILGGVTIPRNGHVELDYGKTTGMSVVSHGE